MAVGGNVGTPGQTCANIAAAAGNTQIASINALNVQAAIIQCGTNDLASGASAATISANIDTIISSLNAPRIYLGTITARFAPNALTAPQEAQRVLLNPLILAKASTRVKIADYNAIIGSDSSYLQSDGLHPNSKGAKLMGSAGLGALMLADSGVPLTAFDTQSASGLNPGPGFAGTGGAAGSGATGVVGTGWSLSGGSLVSSGVAVTASKDAGTGNQVITLSGAFTNASSQFFNINAFPAVGATFTTGDYIEMDAVYKVNTNFTTNMQTPNFYYQVFDSGFGQVLATGNSLANTVTPFNQIMAADGTIRIRTPPVQVAAGSPAVAPAFVGLNMMMAANAGTAIATSGAIQLIQMSIRKVTPP